MIVDQPAFYLLAIPLVILSGISKTGIPGLTGGINVPLLALLISPAQAAAIMLPVLCLIDLFGLRAFRGVYDRANVPMLAVGCILGAVAGTVAFSAVNEHALMLIVGVIAVTFSLNNLFGWARHQPPSGPSWPRGVIWSGLSSFTSFIAHAGNAPLMAYLLPQRLDPRIYIGTTIWFFFAANYLKIVPYAFLGQWTEENLLTSLMLMPFVPVGVKLGQVIQGRINTALFYKISYWALLLTGTKLTVDGVRHLIG